MVCLQCGDSFAKDELKNGELCPSCERVYDDPPPYGQVAKISLPEVNKYVSAIQSHLAENTNSKRLNTSLGICFIRLKLYDKALPFFEKAMEDNYEDPYSYFYAAVCLLKGKKAFVSTRPEIDKMEAYLKAAADLDTKGIFYYFMAYIKYDYFSRKAFKTNPTWQEVLASATEAKVSEDDVAEFYRLTGVERPNCL